MLEDKRVVYAKRRKMRIRKRNRFFAMSFLVILILSGIITYIIDKPKGEIGAEPPATSNAVSDEPKEEPQNQDTQPDGSDTQPNSTENTSKDTNNEVKPVSQKKGYGPQFEEKNEYILPTASQLALPDTGRVDMAYFDDALFIGDSLTQGFPVFSTGIKNAKYAAYIGAGPKQLISGELVNTKGEIVTAIDEILAANAKKVYILVGTNSLENMTDEAFLKYYEDFLVFLTPQLPKDTIYYIQSIPPVIKEKSEEIDGKFSINRITSLNESLALLSFKYGMNYLDIASGLKDDEGYLKQEYLAGNDGIHLNADGYGAWRDYLITHVRYDKSNPYISGSKYIQNG